MDFTPKSDQELIKEIHEDQEKRSLPDGKYEFRVIDWKEGISKNGNQMVTLQINVIDNSGREISIRDWIVPNSSLGLHKLKSFCECTNLSEKYSTGSLSQYDAVGAWGFLETKQEKGMNDNGLPTINIRVKNYLERPNDDQKSAITTTEIADDDIPF